MSNPAFTLADYAKLLEAVRDPVRLQIILLLGRTGKMNVGEIASQFRQSRPAISHHLKILKDTQVAKSEKLGQEVQYWIDRDWVVGCLRALTDMVDSCCRWDV